MKNCTDLEQSRRLMEFLSNESADMWWLYIPAQGKYIAHMHDEPNPHYLARMESYGIKDAAIRCWSLSALLEVLEDVSLEKEKEGWVAFYYGEGWWRESTPHSNPIDSCVSLIETLYKQHLL